MDTKPSNNIFIDARKMEPPEPFTEAVKAMQDVQPGHYIYMLHRMVPRLLFPQADKLAFCYRMITLNSQVHVFLWKESDHHAQSAAEKAVSLLEQT